MLDEAQVNASSPEKCQGPNAPLVLLEWNIQSFLFPSHPSCTRPSKCLFPLLEGKDIHFCDCFFDCEANPGAICFLNAYQPLEVTSSQCQSFCNSAPPAKLTQSIFKARKDRKLCSRSSASPVVYLVLSTPSFGLPTCLRMSRARSGPGELQHRVKNSWVFRAHTTTSIVCINGHRAPKCEHFDRYMMRVRNQGRPLTSCPHIENSTECDCKPREAVIMMRLWKGKRSLELASSGIRPTS